MIAVDPTQPEESLYWVQQGRRALGENDVQGALDNLVLLALGFYYLTNVTPGLELAQAVDRRDLTTAQRARLRAVQAQLVARQPLGPLSTDLTHPVGPGWLNRSAEAGELIEQAVELAAQDSDELTKEIIAGAKRAVHRKPIRAQAKPRVAGKAIRLSDLSDNLVATSITLDTLMWQAVDALEAGHRLEHESRLQTARAIATMPIPAHLTWWVTCAQVPQAIHDGNLKHALSLARSGADLATQYGNAGGRSVFALQRWCLDEWRGDHAFGVEIATHPFHRPDHPLNALAPALSLARAGHLARAWSWIPWGRQWLADGDRDASWLLVLAISARLAGLLHVKQHPLATEWAAELLDELVQYTDSVTLDSRGIITLGPVATFAADLAIDLGRFDEAADYLVSSAAVLDRLGQPPVAMIEWHLADTRLRLATDIDATESITTALSLAQIPGVEGLLGQAQGLALLAGKQRGNSLLTDREQRVLRLIGMGLTNPQIADRLAYSRATIAKDVRRLYAKLGASDRQGLARLANDPHLPQP